MPANLKTPNRDRLGTISLLDDSWTLIRPAVESSARRRAHGSDAPLEGVPELSLPAFLAETEFEILDRAELHSIPGRRNLDVASSSNLPLRTEVEADACVLMVA